MKSHLSQSAAGAERQASYRLVSQLLASRRYAAALVELAEIGAAGEQDSDYWYLQGETWANLGRYREAIQSYNRGLALVSGGSDLLISKATCYLHLGKFKAAVACCDRALALNPKALQAWMLKGAAHQRLGQYRKAYRSYAKASRRRSLSWQERLSRPLRLIYHHR